MAQNFELQSLSSEETIFEQNFENVDDYTHDDDYGFWKQRYNNVLTYLRQNYLRVIKTLFYIILILICLIITLIVVLNYKTTYPAQNHVSAYMPVKSVKLSTPTKPMEYFEIPRPPKDLTYAEREQYILKYLKKSGYGATETTDRIIDDGLYDRVRKMSDKVSTYDQSIRSSTQGPAAALPSVKKLCKSEDCRKKADFVISTVSVAELKTYGCCRSPSSITFEAVVRTKDRFDLIYSSKIKFIEYLPKLENLSGSWAEGSFNEEQVYVFRGVRLVPPTPDE